MSEPNRNLEIYLKSGNYEAINEFLIESSKAPPLKTLIDIDYLITNSSDSLLNHFIINLIYILGEISKNHFLSENYIEFLIKTYFKSDRWIRSEILLGFSKSIRIDDLFKKIIDPIEFALTDDYDPIKINALTIICNTTNTPERFFSKIIKNLESKNSNIVEKAIKALETHIKSIKVLYEILLKDDTLNLINKRILRRVLLTFFNEIHLVEDFKKEIMSSGLNSATKEIINSEIKTYLRILQQKDL